MRQDRPAPLSENVAADSSRSRLGRRIPLLVRLPCRVALRGAAGTFLRGLQDRRRRRRQSPARSATKRPSTVLSMKEPATVVRDMCRTRHEDGLDFETALATRPAPRIGIPASNRARPETKRAIPLQKAPKREIYRYFIGSQFSKITIRPEYSILLSRSSTAPVELVDEIWSVQKKLFF